MSLSLEYPQPSCRSVSDHETEIKGPKVKEHLKKADMKKLKRRSMRRKIIIIIYRLFATLQN